MKTRLENKQRKLKFQFRYCWDKNDLLIRSMEVPELSKPFWQSGNGENHDLAKLLRQVDGVVFACFNSSAQFSIKKGESHTWRKILPKVRSTIKNYYEAEVVEEVCSYRPPKKRDQ